MNLFFSCRLAVLAAILLSITLPSAHAASHAAKKPAAIKKRQAPVHESGEFVNFAKWPDVAVFIDEMVQKNGFSKPELEAVLRRAQYMDSAIQLVKPPPPGKPKNWRAYRARFIEPVRIKAGLAFWDKYEDVLTRAEDEFGVPADIIVGLIGVETIYGRNTGNFRVMDAVTTLAFAYPDTPNRTARMSYFRGELENTLLFSRESNIDPFSILGSYAGAIGWPQFMPGSIRKFAVDFDGDGKIDLRSSPVDAIGSVANFLVLHGWTRGDPVVFPVQVPGISSGNGNAEASSAPAWQRLLGQSLAAQFTLDEIKAEGIQPVVEPPTTHLYTLVDLQNGFDPAEYWLGTGNFFAIAQYNRSYFYAMSVLELGRTIKAARDIR
ncbi:MAG: mltB [Paucimonas sp.]|nr:mltB [Paucimonas sp.]